MTNKKDSSIKVQMLKTIATLITTAFALVAGLAWNSAIQAIIKEFFRSDSEIAGLVVYALIVTVISVLVTVFIGRTLGKIGIELEDD
ncbi:MAG: DUF5654 family protein [Methanobrevibacter sp.]|jgi:uncharacterized membrane protein YidH (DUF202 family)|nr:DUF5654 family protein [Candidatus Methanovirga basalitermitum]